MKILEQGATEVSEHSALRASCILQTELPEKRAQQAKMIAKAAAEAFSVDFTRLLPVSISVNLPSIAQTGDFISEAPYLIYPTSVLSGHD
ncbi:hypothetical protein [Erwinia amylovora]|uniref:hypothetical protein n=1 Tax=Erwinia amylovora TaxID=552 RepID=UPI001F040694|nr:hypothetical protein [Erwinia amylovora]